MRYDKFKNHGPEFRKSSEESEEEGKEEKMLGSQRKLVSRSISVR